MYTRKTRDRWDIESNWGYGWEVECSEYSWREAKEQYKCYVENVGGRCLLRLTKHREKIAGQAYYGEIDRRADEASA